jgi:myotubularin-related protein 6/7/8
VGESHYMLGRLMQYLCLLKIPYPLIALLTRLPQTLEGLSPLSVRCRTFELFTLAFDADTSAVAVFDSVRDLTVTSM